jgi:hypothetical protein
MAGTARPIAVGSEVKVEDRIMQNNIGRCFLEGIDKFIKENLWTLTCSQIHKIYYDFFNDLKKFKGNSNGFTGLSEYLIFRSLYNLLGGSFDCEQISGSNWINEFKTTIKNSIIRIGQSCPIVIYGKKMYPDITVYNADRLHAIAQIKIYLTNGAKELFNEIEKLKALRSQFGDMQALLIIYNDLPKISKIINALKKVQDSELWFHFTILEDNDDPIANILTNNLNLGEFILLP